MNSGIPWWLYLVFGFLFIDLVIVLWIFLVKSRKKKMGESQRQYIKSHWITIIDSFDHDMKHAILDADKLLNYALSQHGFHGTLGEKMKQARTRFSDNNGIWNAHRLRNEIAHELGDVDKTRAKWALKAFKRALNDLGANL